MTATEVQLITYPARPINGGNLLKARPKRGDWQYEPKYNGWRTLVHVPTGTMFNRHGQQLTIAKEFSDALQILRQWHFEWLDCEALERRHNIGRGTLIVLDVILPNLTYVERREILERVIFQVEMQSTRLGDNQVYLPFNTVQGETLYGILKEANATLGCEFFEGVVAKRADSVYPIQLLSPETEFPQWIKYRWNW